MARFLSLVYLLLLVVLTGTRIDAQTYTNGRTQEVVFDPDLAPFYHGVASGDPLSDRVIIWTRVTPDSLGDETIPVDWRMATDPALTDTVATGQLATDADRDYTVKVDVTGLEAGTTYYYGFTALGANSLTGRTKTTPTADQSDHLKFGVVSCSNYQAGYFNAYGHLARRNDLDAIVHLGDYIYEYANFVYGDSAVWQERLVAPDAEIVSLGDYRTRYSTYRLDSQLIRAHQQHPFVSVWDDHESTNDSYEDGAQNHQPATEGDWQDRKDRARRVYFEWMPMRDNGNRSIYRKLSYGGIADLIMLDTRLEGRDEQPDSITAPDFLDPDRTMLGQTQKNWLKQQLTESEARWKIIGQQVIFSEFNVGWAAATTGGSFVATESIFLDIWDGYPAERQELVTFMDSSGIDNIVFLTGDFHSSFAFEVAVPSTELEFIEVPGVGTLPRYIPTPGYDPATGRGAVAVEFATPSITAANFDENTTEETAAGLEAQINAPLQPAPGLDLGNPNPHMKYSDLDRHGYYLLDVRPDTVRADYYYTDVTVPGAKENFGRGLANAVDTVHLQLTTRPAAAKAEQDAPAPPDPPALVSSLQQRAADVQVFSVFPNPVRGEVAVQFGLLTAAGVDLWVVDATGRTLRQLALGRLPAGLYTHRMQLDDLPAGTYYLRLRTPGGSSVQAFVKE